MIITVLILLIILIIVEVNVFLQVDAPSSLSSDDTPSAAKMADNLTLRVELMPVPISLLERQSTILLSRPLFSASRREKLPDTPNPISDIHVQAPRLTGILIYGSVRLAIFNPGANIKAITVLPGSRINGYLLEEVGLGDVLLSRGGDKFRERLSFDQKLVAPEPSYLQQRPIAPAR